VLGPAEVPFTAGLLLSRAPLVVSAKTMRAREPRRALRSATGTPLRGRRRWARRVVLIRRIGPTVCPRFTRIVFANRENTARKSGVGFGGDTTCCPTSGMQLAAQWVLGRVGEIDQKPLNRSAKRSPSQGLRPYAMRRPSAICPHWLLR
jgi:hypothetical protein